MPQIREEGTPSIEGDMTEGSAATSAEVVPMAKIFTRNFRDSNSSVPINVFFPWNPGYNRSHFPLDDPLIEGSKSAVFANVFDTLNNPVCGVTYVGYEWFVLECTEPPAEGATLRYTVINSEPLSLDLLSQERAIDNEIRDHVANMTVNELSNTTQTPIDNTTFG